MRAEREIAGIVLPFVVGTAVFMYAGGVSVSASSAVFSTITTILIGFLLYICHHHISRTATWAILFLCMGTCGALAASTDLLLSVSRQREASWLARAALDFCERIQWTIDEVPFKNETTSQILKALLTGEKTGIPDEVMDAFRASGASHILALSGLHLGIIYAVVRFMTRCLGNTRKAKAARSVILVCTCGFYALATGAGASIVRAFIFILIGECARLSGRPAGLRKVMMAALLIHVAIMPSAIKEVGFQLSYAAITGIAYIFPWLQGFWPGDRHKDAVLTRCARWIWDSAAMSISCQITTGPLAYIYFGTLPTQVILTNMIALPLTGIIIPMALATLITCALGWDIGILIDGTEWMVTLLCESLDLLSTM